MKFYNKDINTIAINALIDCGEILLSNIGVLRCKLLSATIKNNSITPPRQVVEFHFSSSIAANSLTELISLSYSISKEEAETVYNSWLDSIKTETSTGTIYTIDGLGSISTSLNNCTVFSTDKMFVQQLNPLTQEFPQEQITSEPLSEPTIDNSLGSEFEVIEEKSNEPFWRSMAIVFIILFIISVACTTFFYMKEPKEIIREIKIETTITDTVYVNDPKITMADDRITNGKFHIIAGVFKSQANAEKVVKEFTKSGVTPIMEFIKERGEYFVSIGYFNSQQEAQKHLNTLGLANENSLESHWIYKY